MNFKVEQCWCGGDKFNYRISNDTVTLRFTLSGETWTKELATIARDRIADSGACERRNIRFNHR